MTQRFEATLHPCRSARQFNNNLPLNEQRFNLHDKTLIACSPKFDTLNNLRMSGATTTLSRPTELSCSREPVTQAIKIPQAQYPVLSGCGFKITRPFATSVDKSLAYKKIRSVATVGEAEKVQEKAFWYIAKGIEKVRTVLYRRRSSLRSWGKGKGAGNKTRHIVLVARYCGYAGYGVEVM